MPGLMASISLGVAPARAKALCVFAHGRTQLPEEMEQAVIRFISTPDISWLLPQAEGASWYAARAVDPLTDAARGDLAKSLVDVAKTVLDFQAAAPSVPLILAGFSQGACLMLELAFTGKVTPQAIVAFTGCRVGVATDDRANAMQAGIPVYLTAGDADPWIPLLAFAEALVALGQAGAAVRADVFPGRAHKVSSAEIAVLDSVLADLAAGRSPGMGGLR